MARKLIIILANVDPTDGEALSAPIFQATVAAAMSHQVEVVCTGRSAKILCKGSSVEIELKPGGGKRSIHDFIREARAAGAKFYCLAPDLDICNMHKDDLISECCGVLGAAHLIEEIMSNDSKVLTY
ncbi:peroxiredoxin [Hyphomicrobium methylovorum]|uniref:DsrE family protein n=1 Tax=Hyphomicrobium methylovorum TaxID=84 RepID=UPI0015E76B91|nr:peroxiredoxin [Hyphomicrobium methylovorum]